VMLGLGGWAGAAVLWPEREPMAPARPPLPPGDYPAAILDIGAQAPPFEAEGWLNGSPPAPGESGQVIVVDLLALW
jgi:hypothetical protein